MSLRRCKKVEQTYKPDSTFIFLFLHGGSGMRDAARAEGERKVEIRFAKCRQPLTVRRIVVFRQDVYKRVEL